MKKQALLISILNLILFLTGCSDSSNRSDKIIFATSATYPPFEYKQYDEFKGFDIDLANKIAALIEKKAEFKDMQFSAVLPAIQNGRADAAIATLTITEERKKNFDFSDPYYFEGMAVIFPIDKPVKNIKDLEGKKIACQLGSVMEIWLKKNVPTAKIFALDDNNQAIEALKAGHVDYILLDGAQGYLYSKKKPNLSYIVLDQAKEGYGILVKKGSALLPKINQAIQTLKKNGEIDQLINKWLRPADQ